MTRGLRSEAVHCVGGLDLESRYVNMPSGRVIAAKNYEQKQGGGYRRVDGYSAVEESAVPGTGPVVSVAQFDDTTYAWRRNTDESAYELYRSTGGSGWTLVPLGWFIRFNNGTTLPAEGATIEAGTGLTGVISRIVHEAGSWDDGSATGFICLRNVSGDWSTVTGGDNLTGPGASPTYAKAASAGVEVAVTGRPRSPVFANFYGSDEDGAFYWCDGSGYVIEVRPLSNYVAVLDRACDYLEAHAEHLFFGEAESGRIITSIKGTPLKVNGTLGSLDLATGVRMAGLKSYRGVLVVHGDSQTSAIYGQDIDDWFHKKIESVGGKEGIGDGVAVEVDGRLLYLSQAGLLFDFAATDTFGDFESASMSLQIRSAMVARRANLTAIGRRVDKGQCRVFYSDGSGYFFTFFGGQLVGVLPVVYPNPVRCYATNADSSMGAGEISVFGSDDGYVFRTESGADFAGRPVEAFLTFPFAHVGMPMSRKRWRKLFIEGKARGRGCTLRVRQGHDLGEGGYGVAQDREFVGGDGGIWGSSTWGAFTWGGGYGAEECFELTGTSRSTSIAIYSPGDDTDGGVHEIDTLILNYTLRGAVRD